MYFSVFLIPPFVRATCLLWLFAFDFTPTSITAQKLPSSALCRLLGIDGKGGCDDSFSALGSGQMHQRGCSTLKHVHEKGQVLNRGIHMKSRCCIKSSVSLRGMIEELEMLWCIARMCGVLDTFLCCDAINSRWRYNSREMGSQPQSGVRFTCS